MIKTLARERKAFQAGTAYAKVQRQAGSSKATFAEWWCSWSRDWERGSRETKARKTGRGWMVNGLKCRMRV